MKFYKCSMCDRIFAEWEWKDEHKCPACKEKLILTDGGYGALDDTKENDTRD